MGTSSSYGGPTGKTSLLPPWAEDLTSEELNSTDNLAANGGGEDNPEHADDENLPVEAPVVPSLTWRAPKGAISRLARATGSGSATKGLRALGRSYVRASGGARTAATAARTGRATTARLGNLLAGGIRNGFRQTVDRLGLQQLLGQDADAVLAAFVDLLAPDGAILEEAAARIAMIQTLEAVFDRYQVQDGGLDALDRIDAAALGEIVELSVVNYVNAHMQQELVNRIERGTLPEAQANQLMNEIKDFIGEIVKLDFASVDVVALDWEGAEGRRLVAEVYEAAYTLLEAA